jgi:hypothetical protein
LAAAELAARCAPGLSRGSAPIQKKNIGEDAEPGRSEPDHGGAELDERAGDQRRQHRPPMNPPVHRQRRAAMSQNDRFMIS